MAIMRMDTSIYPEIKNNPNRENCCGSMSNCNCRTGCCSSKNTGTTQTYFCTNAKGIIKNAIKNDFRFAICFTRYPGSFHLLLFIRTITTSFFLTGGNKEQGKSNPRNQ